MISISASMHNIISFSIEIKQSPLENANMGMIIQYYKLTIHTATIRAIITEMFIKQKSSNFSIWNRRNRKQNIKVPST
jgi:hypothetical protein